MTRLSILFASFFWRPVIGFRVWSSYVSLFIFRLPVVRVPYRFSVHSMYIEPVPPSPVLICRLFHRRLANSNLAAASTAYGIWCVCVSWSSPGDPAFNVCLYSNTLVDRVSFWLVFPVHFHVESRLGTSKLELTNVAIGFKIGDHFLGISQTLQAKRWINRQDTVG